MRIGEPKGPSRRAKGEVGIDKQRKERLWTGALLTDFGPDQRATVPSLSEQFDLFLLYSTAQSNYSTNYFKLGFCIYLVGQGKYEPRQRLPSVTLKLA